MPPKPNDIKSSSSSSKKPAKGSLPPKKFLKTDSASWNVKKSWSAPKPLLNEPPVDPPDPAIYETKVRYPRFSRIMSQMLLTVKSSLAILIIDCFFVGVREDLICLANLLKYLLCLFLIAPVSILYTNTILL